MFLSWIFQGSPQWIEILFKDVRTIKGFEFQFQGGFVGQKCSFLFFKKPPAVDDLPDLEFLNFYPEDTNYIQTSMLDAPIEAKFIRIMFNESTDFYGRVIIYRFTVLWRVQKFDERRKKIRHIIVSAWEFMISIVMPIKEIKNRDEITWAGLRMSIARVDYDEYSVQNATQAQCEN